MRILTTVAIVTTTVLALVSSSDARVWTSGKFTLEAEYVKTTDDGLIVLRQADGTEFQIARKKLSDADIDFIEREFEANPFKKMEKEEREKSPFTQVENTSEDAEKTATDETVAQPAEGESPETQKAGDRRTVFANGVEFAFRWCPAGTFMMGSPETEFKREGNEKQHEVTFEKGFWILETEVTQAQWKAIFPVNPSRFKGDNRPVERVPAEQCVYFCKLLSEKTGVRMALPTEAQWEYACRAGTTTPFSFGSELNGDKAVCDGEEPYGTNVRGVELHESAPVKTKEPNAWGIYDMHGNVAEWCLFAEGERRGGMPVRGGSWDDDADDCRAASRSFESSHEREDDTGFRIIIL